MSTMGVNQFEGEIPPLILEKIKRGQHFISTNLDLSEAGYVKDRIRSGKQGWENLEKRREKDAARNAKRTPGSRSKESLNKHRFKLESRFVLEADLEESMSCLSGTSAESERLTFHHVIYDHSNPSLYLIVLTVSEHNQLHAGSLSKENMERLYRVLKNREYIVESPVISEEQNLNLKQPLSINIESKELDKNAI